MCGEGKKSKGGGLPGGSGAGACPRRTAAQVSENRVAKSFLPFLPGSLWQSRRQVSWEAPGLAARTLGGGGAQVSSPASISPFRNTPRGPFCLACVWGGNKGAWLKKHFEFRGESSHSWCALWQVISLHWAQLPPMSNEENSDTYLIALF